MINCYCDGSAVKNACGWAFVRDDGTIKSGAVWHQGSNVAELLAVIEALASFSRASHVCIHTDCHYVILGASKRTKHDGKFWAEFDLWKSFHKSVQVVKVDEHKLHRQAHHLARAAVFEALK